MKRAKLRIDMSDKIIRLITEKPYLFDYPDLPSSETTEEQKAANRASRPDWMMDLISRNPSPDIEVTI